MLPRGRGGSPLEDPSPPYSNIKGVLGYSFPVYVLASLGKKHIGYSYGVGWIIALFFSMSIKGFWGIISGRVNESSQEGCEWGEIGDDQACGQVVDFMGGVTLPGKRIFQWFSMA